MHFCGEGGIHADNNPEVVLFIPFMVQGGAIIDWNIRDYSRP
jgi:hypothetical protein